MAFEFNGFDDQDFGHNVPQSATLWDLDGIQILLNKKL